MIDRGWTVNLGAILLRVWLVLCLVPWLMLIGHSNQDPSNETLFTAATLLVTLPISIVLLFVMSRVGDLFLAFDALRGSLHLFFEWAMFVGLAYWQWTRVLPFLARRLLVLTQRPFIGD